MFDANAEDELWQNKKRWNLKSWDFYENCRVHTLILEDGIEIHMLAERKYPLTKETLEKMMSLKLVVESASDGAYNLLRSIQKQIDEYGSYDGNIKNCKELASLKQTALALAIPEKMATGKETSNPFMAGSLPKTTRPTYLVSLLLGIKELLQDNVAEGLNTASSNNGTSTTIIPGAITAEQKILKKNDLKGRSILMMTLPSEHLLTFNKHKDAKSLFEAIEIRFGGNEATKKTQKTLLKQMYKTFNASSSESLGSIFNRLQKIISQLTILGEIITPEELNLKFLRSLPTKWGMHVVVWRNKSDLGSISFDDLYKKFKIVEPEVKRSVISSSNSGSQNLAFLSGHSSTNNVNTANVHVSTGSTPVSTASTNNSIACLSDATIYAYLATQPNGSQVVHEDLEQIHKDDLDEMDLKWQLALLSMKGRKFYQRTGKKIIINGSDIAGYDKKKVECFNCHKFGHFARECRNPRSQENRNRSQDSSRRTVNVEESSSKAILDQLIGNQISDNNKKGLGYNVVPPPLTGLFAPPSIDLSNSGLEKFKQPEFEGYGVKVNKGASENVSKEVKKTSDAPIIEDWVSDCDEDETVVLESLNVQKPKQADQPRKVSQNPRNNSTSWNTPMPKKLGVGFQFTPKACFVCGSFNHLIKDCDFHDKRMVQKPVLNNVKKGTGQREVRPVWTNAMRVNHQKFSNSRRNFAPTAVLTKSGLVPFSTARQSFSRTTAPVSVARSFNTAVPSVNVAKPRTNAFQKSHSSLRRPFYQQTALKNRNLNNKVNTAKVISVNTVKGKRMTSVIGEQGINAVKPTAYWAWRPKIKMINHVYKNTRSCISLAIPGQTATGKESSNPFMAGSLPKIISPVIHLSQKVRRRIMSEDLPQPSCQQSKESLAQTLTMLMKKVKRLEDKLKL
ncbi:ribonuclease H-like domain-containing protein [Tanacetum coccineum]